LVERGGESIFFRKRISDREEEREGEGSKIKD
jgi:hypothetical protein